MPAPLQSSMVELTRVVRFCVNSEVASAAGVPDIPRSAQCRDDEPNNTFAAYPSMRGLGRFYELEVTCRGRIDPSTGYFVNIKTIDSAVRTAAVPIIAEACRTDPTAGPEAVLPHIVRAINERLQGRVARVRWRLTPYYSVEMAIDSPGVAFLRQQFEFAASHRLHCPALTDDENRRLFGKCNHAGGHGHNYRIEPCVEVPAEAAGVPPAISLGELERLTNLHVIERYDHKHLNVDTPEFAPEQGGVNPSVENIARVCFQRLRPAIESATGGRARLRSVTVWETDKTCCRYPVD